MISDFLLFVVFLMIRRPPSSTPLYSSAASDVYKRQPGLPGGERRFRSRWYCRGAVSYTHLRAHETKANLVCRLLLEKKKKKITKTTTSTDLQNQTATPKKQNKNK